MKKTLFFILLMTLGFSTIGLAQDQKTKRDSIQRDSTIHNPSKSGDSLSKKSSQLYKNINKYSQKSKFGRLLSGWVLDDSPHDSVKKVKKTFPNYAQYAGKIIRNIVIETKDPFGYSLKDSTETPHSWFEKAGNSVHVKSREMAIDKFLLFKKETPLDTFLLHESARLLRDQNYVHRVLIIPKNVEGARDSVDVVVKVLDSWSLIPEGSFSTSSMKLGLLERNFIGTGHQVNLEYSKRFEDGNNGYDVQYVVPNFRNTFINTNLKYSQDFNHYHDKYVSINRRFFSSLTRWAGGIFFQDRSLRRPVPGDTVDFINQDFQFFYQNYWAGRSFPLSDTMEKESENLNLIVALRAFFLHYKNSPNSQYDPADHFSNEQFYLAKIGLNSLHYVRDQYIFKNGEIEDVPVGHLFSLTGGIQEKHQQSRLYLGMQTSYGTYFKKGFFSGNLELGSFFNHGNAEQTTLSLKLNYFSDLIVLSKGWRMRQFIKPQIVLGFHRKNSFADRLSLNERSYFNGVTGSEYVDYDRKDGRVDYKTGSIQGFDSQAIGTRKYVLDLQTQFYAPWSLWGFHFNPFVDVSLGYLSGGEEGFGSNKLYSAFSVGLIIQNDYLVFNSFQFSLSYYPSMPGEGSNIFKFNALKNGDYGFQNFEASQPRTVIYE